MLYPRRRWVDVVSSSSSSSGQVGRKEGGKLDFVEALIGLGCFG